MRGDARDVASWQAVLPWSQRARIRANDLTVGRREGKSILLAALVMTRTSYDKDRLASRNTSPNVASSVTTSRRSGASLFLRSGIVAGEQIVFWIHDVAARRPADCLQEMMLTNSGPP